MLFLIYFKLFSLKTDIWTNDIHEMNAILQEGKVKSKQLKNYTAPVEFQVQLALKRCI